jgi:ubiquinone/menaquinone biosynthesis C-methylase UbiE
VNLREYEIMYHLEDTYWWYRGMRKIAYTLIPELFHCKSSAKILDAGCGTGARLQHLLEIGNRIRKTGLKPQTIGIDLFSEALKFCKIRKLENLVQASVEDLPFRDETFDFITSYDVLVCVSDDEKALREYYRVCRPGGKVFLTVAAFNWLRGEHDRAGQVLRRYTESDLCQKLEKAGFTVEKTTYANTFLVLPIFLFRKAVNLLCPATTDQEAISDFHFTPAYLNTFLTSLLYLEAFLLKWIRFPVGVTLMVKGRKPV